MKKIVFSLVLFLLVASTVSAYNLEVEEGLDEEFVRQVASLVPEEYYEGVKEIVITSEGVERRFPGGTVTYMGMAYPREGRMVVQLDELHPRRTYWFVNVYAHELAHLHAEAQGLNPPICDRGGDIPVCEAIAVSLQREILLGMLRNLP